VFVIWTHPLFHESVRLLLEDPEVEWVGSASDYETARTEVLNLQPDTIIVEEVENPISDKIIKILEGSSWNLRVIGLNLDSNKLSVYHRENRTVAQAEDFLHLITEDSQFDGGC
jgi:DNA-binding NarL/FixJ family response regulator